MFNVSTVSATIGDHTLSLETGKIARQADGAVMVRAGDSVVLVTAVAGAHRPEAAFFPLVVDYVEKFYAGGRIPGGFLRREGRLSDDETLVCRLIDRPIRPLFPDGYKGDTQIIATVLQHDGVHDTRMMAMTGASAALMLSGAPFEGPIAGVRVARVDGALKANPNLDELGRATLDIIMACSRDAIVMVEGEADEATEAEMLEALDFGHAAAQPLLLMQEELAAAAGKPRREFVAPAPSKAFVDHVAALATEGLEHALAIRTKLARYARIKEAKDAAKARLDAAFESEFSFFGQVFDDLKSTLMREQVLALRTRLDGRGLTEVRPIETEVDILPRTHGSALFTRGETQSIVVLTLGTDRDSKLVDNLLGKRDERFLLHYNFPPFSVNEARPLRGTGRREIGHGFLAHRALARVMPEYEDFPYVVRLVSEITESNGSSSMATVCGGSLALMAGGVPLRAPVAGIAMGLIHDGQRYAILSDILGDEDHLGDMDFKVAGTARGITSVQMDIKIKGLSRDIMAAALSQARDGRLHILGRMNATLSEPADDISAFAPRIRTIQISQDRIRDVIGAGGKTIRSIQERTGCAIEVTDDGTVRIASADQGKSDEAIRIIRALTASPIPGQIYLGVVAKVAEFGAFITILPNVDGLCHISELSDSRVERTEDVVQEGDEVIVKCVAIEGSKIRLSRKEALGKTPNVVLNQIG